MGAIISKDNSDNMPSDPFEKLIYSIVQYPKNGTKVPVFTPEELSVIFQVSPTNHDTSPISLKICSVLMEKHNIDAFTLTRSDMINEFKNVDDHLCPTASYVMKEVHVYINSHGGYILSLREDNSKVIIEALIPKPDSFIFKRYHK